MATDIEVENGPMPLLRQNIAANCRAGTSTGIDDNADQGAGKLVDVTAEAGEVSSDRFLNGGVVRHGGSLQTSPPHIPSPSPPPYVCPLRWGDKDQLSQVLSVFDGAGPDVILA